MYLSSLPNFTTCDRNYISAVSFKYKCTCFKRLDIVPVSRISWNAMMFPFMDFQCFILYHYAEDILYPPREIIPSLKRT